MDKPTSLKVSYKFWPVGQGLFSSGRLDVSFNDQNNSEKSFHWVYDCGTISNQEFLKTSIEEYKKSFRSSSNADSNIKPKIDLVVISHFDKDHISGLVKLLNTFSIQTLLLPYMQLWQRLIIAFDEDIDSENEIFQFFINPAQYISDNFNENVTEILFVQPADEGSQDPENKENSNGVPDSNGSLIINTNRSDIDEIDLIDSKQKINVQYSGKTITILNIWEFIPYNDANVCFSNSARTWDVFKDMVNERRDALLKLPKNQEVKNIKDIYDKQFGRNSKSRNIISLFLYAGPSPKRLTNSKRLAYTCSTLYCFHSKDLLFKNYKHIHYLYRHMYANVLYTGDGYLETSANLDKLRSYIGVSKIEKIFCLQVMHHGSKTNWYEGIAKELEPCISVFCSDPSNSNYKHPDGEVVRDFLRNL